MVRRKHKPWWFKKLQFPGIVASSRVLLSRNLAGENFPGHAKPADLIRIRDLLCEHIAVLPPFRNGSLIYIEDTSESQLQQYQEQILISPELRGREHGGALYISHNYRQSIMINELDHLRIQVLRADADLRSAWRYLYRTDDNLEKKVEFAFHPDYGYLTASPGNVGTGLSVCVLLNLHGLYLMDQLEPVLRALSELEVLVTGTTGEGTESPGKLYQLSNRQTLGETEEEIIDRLSSIAAETANQEENARLLLLQNNPDVIVDYVARSLALLQNARIMNSIEASDHLSILRMGLDAGLLDNVTVSGLNGLVRLSLPGHMQITNRRVIASEERDIYRASLLKYATAKITLTT